MLSAASTLRNEISGAYRQHQKAIQETAAAHPMAQRGVHGLTREAEPVAPRSRKLSQSFAR